MRQVSKFELDLESLRDKKGNIARQIFSQGESAKTLADALTKAKEACDEISAQIEDLKS